MISDKKIIAGVKTLIVCGVLSAFLSIGFIGALQYQNTLPILKDYGTIYVSAPLALDSSTIIVNSIKLSLEEAHYEVLGKHIKLEILDDGDAEGGWVEAKERTNALKAAKDPTTIAYIGPINSGAAKISLPILNEAKIIQISPSNTWPGLTKSGFTPGEPGIFYPNGVRHYVRVCTTDDLQGPAGAEWALTLGFTSVYIVDDGEAYGAGIARLFGAEAKKIELTVLGTATLKKEKTDFAAVAKTIIASKATLLYYGGTTPNGGPELLQALREASSSIAFMGPDGIFEDDFITRTKKQFAEGVYVTAVGASPEEVDSQAAKEYVKKYKNAFHVKPDVFGALAYESTNVLLAGIFRSGTLDHETILNEVKNTRNYPGMFGKWSFDANGDTTQTLLSGSRVENGDFKFMRVLEVK